MRRWAIALVGLAACDGGPPAAPPRPAADVAAEPSSSFQQRAHVEAFQALLPAVETMLTQTDPPAAFAVGLGPLRPPPLGRVPSDDLLARTWRDAQEIQPRFLAPEQAAMLRAIAFALQRRRAQLDGAPPWSTDPAWVLREAGRTWSLLADGWAAGTLEDPTPVLLALAEFVDTGTRSLGATSAAALRGAIAGYRALEAETARVPWPEAAREAAATWQRSLAEAAARFEALATTLPAEPAKTVTGGPTTPATGEPAKTVTGEPAKTVTGEPAKTVTGGPTTPAPRSAGRPDDAAGRTNRVPSTDPDAPARHSTEAPPHASEPGVRRLPDRLGADALRRRLEQEEHVQRSAEALYVALGPTIVQLQRLAEQDVADDDPPRPVDAVRCRMFEPAFAGLRATQPRLARRWLDCDAALRRWGDAPRRDAAFRVAALERAVVEPLRRERRAQEHRVLALLAGRIAPVSQQHAQTVALAVALGDPPTVAHAARLALHAACGSAAALWVHGELGTDETLRAQLDARCRAAGPVDWVTWALEHPRDALGGIELWRLGHGPAEVVALDRFWWMPAGLVDPLMRPAAADPTPPSISVHTEPVTP